MPNIEFAASIFAHLYFFLINHLYDPITFIAVIALGVLQAVVGADSGYLAIKSLKKPSTPLRSAQITILAGSAVLIVVVTVVIGYLADRSEHKVDDRADKAEKALETLKAGQVVSEGDLNQAIGQLTVLAQLVKDCKPGDDARLQESFKSVENLLKSASHPPVSIPVAPAPPPTPAPQPVNAPATIQDLEHLRSQLVQMDGDNYQIMVATIGGMRQDYQDAYADYSREHPGLPVTIDPARQQQLDKIFQSARPSIQNKLDNRDKRFNDIMLPVIESTRTKALQLLQNRIDRKTDATAFSAALADAQKKAVIPDSWNSAGFLYTLNYVPMENYLSTLEQQLKDGK